MIAFRLINPPWTFVSWVAAALGMWEKNKMAIMPAKEWGNPGDNVKTRLKASLWSTGSWRLLERDTAEPTVKVSSRFILPICLVFKTSHFLLRGPRPAMHTWFPQQAPTMSAGLMSPELEAVPGCSLGTWQCSSFFPWHLLTSPGTEAAPSDGHTGREGNIYRSHWMWMSVSCRCSLSVSWESVTND